ncbi:MAG: TPM domain-containing protein [Bacteroidota bacterium]
MKFLIEPFGILTFGLLLLIFACNEEADPSSQATPAPEEVSGHVADLGQTLSATEATQLEEQLEAYEKKLGVRFLLYTEKKLPGSLEEMSKRLEQLVPLGQSGFNNGASILLARSERQAKLEINHGLEWQVPQSTINVIFQRLTSQYLSQDQFFEGYAFAFDTLYQLTQAIPWQLAYSSLDEVKSAGNSAQGKIVAFPGKVLRANGTAIEGVQFDPSYQMRIQGRSDLEAELFYSYNMDALVSLLTEAKIERTIYARVRTVSPALELELLGVE